ncbi:MAG TPA: hypothetical protein VLH56_16440 [Dissulfurispiraceae bacterium]|nr:hypothetical protein [Dissulfurispiraceae bacterium]
MRDLIAELQGMAPAGRQGGMRDLIAEMGEEPLRPNYGRDNKPDYWQEQLKPSLIETGKAAARVTGATLGGLAMMPFAGIAGLGKTIISGLDEGGKTLEEIGGIPGRLISTPEEAQSIETIGKAMEPFHMAGEGLKEIVRLTPAKDTILEPIVGTIGEVSAMFALPGVPKTAKAWWDKLPHRKRVMVVDQVKADIASGQFTSAEIREMWKDPANREALLKRYQGVGEEGGTMRQPSRPTNPPDSGRALPEGQGFELRPRPGEIRDIIAEMGKEGPKALPPGQGFELRPTAAEVRDIIAEMGQSRPALPYPEGVGEGFVSKPGTTEAPIVTKAGDPFKTEKTAEKAGDKQGLDWNLYEVTQQEGGFAITRKMGREIRPVSPKPESILDMIRKDKVVETGESPEVASLTQKLTSTEAWLRKNAAFKGTPMYDVNIQVAEAARGKLSDLGIEIKPPPETAQPGAIVKAAIPEGQGTDMPEIVQPRADAVWQRQREKIENAQNIIGFIQASGGMDLTGWDYPPDRHPDLRRVHKKGASSPDVVAETLKDEGFTGFEDANDLLDKIASGNARNIFTPGKQDVMIERQLRREQNEWIEGRLADLEVEGIDAGTAREIIPNHKSRALDEIRSERLIDPANEEAALKEVEDFFSEVTSQKAATPKGDFKTADLEKPSKSDIIPPVTLKPGTANIPPETNPEAVGGKKPLATIRNQDGEFELYKNSFGDFYVYRGAKGFDEDTPSGAYYSFSPELAERYATTDGQVQRVTVNEKKLIDFRKVPDDPIKSEWKEFYKEYGIPEDEIIEVDIGKQHRNTYAENYEQLLSLADKYGYDGFIGEEAGAPSALLTPKAYKKLSAQAEYTDPGTGYFEYDDYPSLPNPSRPPEVGGQSVLSNQRGSIPIAESEILQAILKTRGKIEEAMPHLEALGRSVYEGGKQRFLDWQAAMKGKLGDLWEGFKAKMRAVWEGVTKPLMNEKGAVDVAPAVKAVKEVKDVMAEGRKIADEYLGAISTRLGNIDPSLKNTMRKLEFRRGMKATESTNRVMPFIKKADKMNKADKAAFDLARKNGDPGKLKELVIKYNLGKEYHELRNVLKELYDEATAVGYDVGYRPNYHPRVLKDTKGFLEYFYKKADWPILEQAIREQEVKLQRYLTEDEKAKLINGMLRGYPSGQISLSKPGQLKGRSVEHITPELNEFYMDSDAALIQYISDVTDAVEARKLFGVGKKGGKVGDLNDTIGGYVLKLLQEGKIKPQQEQVLKDILAARFNEVGTRGLFSLYKNVSYIDTMGSPISAITQIGDLAWALYKNGPWQTVKATTQATVGRSMFKKEDLGIGRVAEEFSDQTKMARAVSKTFDLIGLTKIDNIGKEALINSTYAKARQQAMTDKGTAALRKELEPIFEGETGQLIKDLRTGKITENVKLYLFNVLSDFQPISLSEMPQQYLTGGNGRIFYMLKTFTLKQFDAFRREAFQKIATEGQRTQGIKNLVHLAACFAVANASADFIKDLILGRPINIEDKVVDNMLRLVGISKFVTWKAREEGVGSASVRQIMPPFKAVDALSKDINSAGDEKGLEITQSIPVVGKLYYWWFGKGAEKSERKAAGMGKLVEPKGLAGLK